MAGRDHNGMHLCPTCHRLAVEHRHTLTKVLANGIWDFARQTRGRPTELKSLGWSRTRWQNFSKLKYWSLITQIRKKSGEWLLTGKGLGFVTGEIAIPCGVWTWNDVAVEFVGPELFLKDVWLQMPDYHDRKIFGATSRPGMNVCSAGMGTQAMLFN